MLQIENDNFQYKHVDAEESKHNTNSHFSTYNLLKREGGRGYFIDRLDSGYCLPPTKAKKSEDKVVVAFSAAESALAFF